MTTIFNGWPQAGQGRTTARGAAGSLRVLLVDDNPYSLGCLAELLTLWGRQVTLARDAPEALQAAASFRPQVVLLDVGLAGTDGPQLARRLRRLGGRGAPILVALTGCDRDEFPSGEGGFDHSLREPVDPWELQDLLRDPGRPGGPGGKGE